MIATEARPTGGRPAKVIRSFAGDLRDCVLYELDLSVTVRFPNPKYQSDPAAFAREVLGVDPWSKQIEILEAVRDHGRVAVRSGHKIGKSNSAVILALWFFCSFDDARVVMTSTTARQVDQILWRELKMIRSRSGWCVECKEENRRRQEENPINPTLIPRPCSHSALIREVPGELARTGIKSADFREVVGFTAKEAEAVAGISGRNLLYIVDEASGVVQEIFEAIEGNRAGGARIAMFSNPTRTTGEFFEAFYSKKDLYLGITVSSEETPNVVLGRDVVPGLANRAWVEEKKEEWGEESALYKIRVKGEHVLSEDGQIFSVHAIGEAEARWAEVSPAGRLYIGLDPAGPSGAGDETMFCVRRGLKAIKFVARRGIGVEQIAIELFSIISEERLPRERAVVVIDREGSIGAELYGYLRNLEDTHEDLFTLVAVRASDRAVREAHIYDRVRDELASNLYSWMVRDGGAIPEDAKLSAELHSLGWIIQANGRQKVTPKDVIRKAIGRSPDRYDALALSVWEPLSERDEDLRRPQENEKTTRPDGYDDFDPVESFDPYGGSDAWQP